MTTSKESRISALPSHLREQLRQRLAGQAGTAGIPRAEVDGPAPLSFAQQRLWFLAGLRPDDPEYNSAYAVRLTGALDVAALAAALEALWQRHDVLRTTVSTVDGRGVQTVQPAGSFALSVVDCDAAGVDEVLAAEYARPFDLAAGPLFRALLVRLGPGEHVLLLTAHHIVTDGRSMGVLAEELGVLYGGGELPELPLRYVDYAVWQRDRHADGGLAGDLAYWRERLAGSAPLDLPTDRPRPAVRGTAGGVIEFEVPADVADGLGELARERGTTLFGALVAACQVLLARYTGQDDIAIGTAVSGRSRPELERLVGFFVNTVVLRSTVDGAGSFGALLEQVRETVLSAFAHDEVPFEQVVDAVGAERDPGRNPLFDVMVLLHDSRGSLPGLRGVRAEPVPVERRSANFDLSIEFVRTDGALAGVLEYSAEPGTWSGCWSRSWPTRRRRSRTWR
jgi:condensation domain-containing protein